MLKKIQKTQLSPSTNHFDIACKTSSRYHLKNGNWARNICKLLQEFGKIKKKKNLPERKIWGGHALKRPGFFVFVA